MIGKIKRMCDAYELKYPVIFSVTGSREQNTIQVQMETRLLNDEGHMRFVQLNSIQPPEQMMASLEKCIKYFLREANLIDHKEE